MGAHKLATSWLTALLANQRHRAHEVFALRAGTAAAASPEQLAERSESFERNSPSARGDSKPTKWASLIELGDLSSPPDPVRLMVSLGGAAKRCAHIM